MDQRRTRDLYCENGFQYKTRRTRGNVKYLSCKYARERGCKGTGKLTFIDDWAEFEVINGEHNHPPEENQVASIEFRRLVKEACIRERGTLKNIYDRLAARNEEGAREVTFNSISRSMLRWRHSTTPNIPRSLEDLAGILDLGIVAADGQHAVIFGNAEFVAEFGESQYTFIDGTFRTVPRQPSFGQILTIFSTCMDHAFPIIHVFMERRTRILYAAVFAYIRQNFPNFVNGNIMTDFESALVESLRASYPEANLHGCFFHYCQAVLRKARVLGIPQQVHGSERGKIFMRKYYALALLPAELIEPTLQSLQTLIDIQNTATIELAQLERGTTVFRVAKKSVIFNNRLNQAWEKLSDGRFTVSDFLRQAVHFVENLDLDLQRWNANVEEDDQEPILAAAVPPLNAPLAQRFPAPNLPPRAVSPPPLAWFQPIPNPNLPFLPQPPNHLPPRALPPHPIPNPNLLFPPPAHNHLLPRAPSPHPIPSHNLLFPPQPPIHLPSRVLSPQPPAIVQPPNPPSPFQHLDRTPSPPPIPSPPQSPIRSLSPVSNPPSPIPVIEYNFPPIPVAVQRAFEALGDDDADEIVIHQVNYWEPTIEASEFEETMPACLRCAICYLNRVQYALECGHVFCTSCTDRIFNVENASCGICRRVLHPDRHPNPIYLG